MWSGGFFLCLGSFLADKGKMGEMVKCISGNRNRIPCDQLACFHDIFSGGGGEEFSRRRGSEGRGEGLPGAVEEKLCYVWGVTFNLIRRSFFVVRGNVKNAV